VNPLDDLPQGGSAHETAQAAETAFRVVIDTFKLFLVQREDRNDYGSDVQIEARDNDAVTNIRAHVQLKGTHSPTKADGSVSVSVARSNLNYLLAQPDSLYVCFHLPSQRLLARYADDVYREYEHRQEDWTHQGTVTVALTQAFDETFQRQLYSRLLAVGRSARDRRLQWAATPPEQIQSLVQDETAIIEVPPDPIQARAILTELYEIGNDAAISSSFARFAAVLGSLPRAMDFAYMAEVNLGLRGAAFDKDRVRQALEVFQTAMNSGNVQPGSSLYCIGNAWLSLHDYEKARDSYLEALERLDTPQLSGVAAQCSKNLGAALEGLGEIDEARVRYEQALELDADLGEAHLALALWYRRKADDPLLVLRHLDQVMPRGGSAVQMSTVQGWRIEQLFRVGDAEGAFREIASLLGQADHLKWVWQWCATQVARFGKTSPDAAQASLRFWRGYLREHPEDRRAEGERLLCLWKLRAAGISIEINFTGFKRAIVDLIENDDPDRAFLWDRVGHWAQYDGDWNEAEAAYRKAYELEPSRYGYCLGTALNFLHRYDEALPILLSNREQDAMSWFQIAVANEGVGDIEGSISAYQRAVKLNPDYDLAWFNLGGIYWNSRDIARATETWRTAMSRFPDHELASKLRREMPVLFD
jgi:tetratricopeptide (TPR) repeat protein